MEALLPFTFYQMRYEIEYHLSMPETNQVNKLDRIEDIQHNFLFTSGKKPLDFTGNEVGSFPNING